MGRHVLADLEGTNLKIVAILRDKQRPFHKSTKVEVACVDGRSSGEDFADFLDRLKAVSFSLILPPIIQRLTPRLMLKNWLKRTSVFRYDLWMHFLARSLDLQS